MVSKQLVRGTSLIRAKEMTPPLDCFSKTLWLSRHNVKMKLRRTRESNWSFTTIFNMIYCFRIMRWVLKDSECLRFSLGTMVCPRIHRMQIFLYSREKKGRQQSMLDQLMLMASLWWVYGEKTEPRLFFKNVFMDTCLWYNYHTRNDVIRVTKFFLKNYFWLLT